MLEFSGETNKRKSTMLGEVFHGLQLRKILVLSLWLKVKLSQMDTLTITVFLKHQSLMLTQKLRKLEQLLSTLKRPLMPGERDSLQTLDQSSHTDFLKEKPSQMDTLSTMITS